jgi:hypothetical protein
LLVDFLVQAYAGLGEGCGSWKSWYPIMQFVDVIWVSWKKVIYLGKIDEHNEF